MRNMKQFLSAFVTAVMLLTCTAMVFAAENQDKDLLLHYEFENVKGTTVTDSSGNQNDGTIKGNGAVIEGDVLTLPGGNNGSGAAYVELPTGVFDKQDTLSISVWMKNETGAGNYAGLFFGTTENMPVNYWLMNPANPAGEFKSVITNYESAGTPYNTEVGFSPTVAGNGIAGPKTGSGWALYTTVIEPGSMTAYYNGTKVGTVATGRNISEFGDDLVAYIGRSSYPDIFYKGGVKDLRVYTRAITQAEVLDLYNEAMGEALLLHYDFENANGTTLADVSGNGHDGKIYGSGYSVKNGEMTFPGGAAGSDAAYVQLPTGVFDNQDTLTISLWLKNETEKGNFSAMYFGTESTSHYWLMNPGNATGTFKSVITENTYTGEYGFSPTNGGNGLLGPASSGNYSLYTTVIEPGTISVYYKGQNCGTVSTGVSVSEFGENLSAYLGKSPYPDMFFKGKISDVKVYTKVLAEYDIINEYYLGVDDKEITTAVLEKDKAALILDKEEVTANITLPGWGENGSKITWASSKEAYLAADGTVTRPDAATGDVKVTLTATLTLGGESVEKQFEITVLADTPENNFKVMLDAYELGQSVAWEDIFLPNSLDGGIELTWSSSDESVITKDGYITRPAVGAGSAYATLTVKAELDGMTREKSFEIEVIEEAYGKILTYVRSANNHRTDALHYAYSKDGDTYTALNNNRPILYWNERVDHRMGSPIVFRKADGTYGAIATDNNNSAEVIVYDSENLLYFTNPRTVMLNTKGVRVSNISCYYNGASGTYDIYYEGNDGNSYYVSTKDFVKMEQPINCNYKKDRVKGTLPENASEASVFEVTKAEYDAIITKWQRVVNTTVSELEEVTVKLDTELTADVLPEKATANYTDGSTKQFGIIWDEKELAAVDTAKAGTYTVTGTLNQPEYADVLVEQRADPWTFLGDDGYYYFTGSYPVCGWAEENQAIGYDRVVLRRAKTLQGLAEAEEVTIWHADDEPSLYRYIWAPEVHQINGTWYVFFTASLERANPYNIRPHVLVCEGGDPMNPDHWEIHRVTPMEGDTFSVQQFSLDMTHFESAGTHYVVWAANPGDFSNLYIASVDEDQPWQLTSTCTKVTKPDFSWENPINEGPAVIKNDGKVYLCYSAAAVNYTYCVGMLVADEGADLLDINSWTKYPIPLLSTDDLINQCGPGHNSFTTDENGNPVIVYHARPVHECSSGGDWEGTVGRCEYVNPGENSLIDPCRHARVKSVNFAVDGTPILNMTPEEELKEENKTITVTIVVNETGKVQLPYEDVAEKDWFYDAVYYTYVEGLMTGMDPVTFGPYGTLSRAQFALILYRMEGTPAVTTEKSFDDITGDEWYGPAVLWAAENGIVSGYENGNFGPVDLITREQMAVMMHRYAKYLKQDVTAAADFSSFKDAASVSAFATDAMKWAVGNGIITGKDNGTLLDPQGNTARSEAAIIIQRFME